ncbi:hypothetical protein T02_8103, partial [Trichinella nativa]
MLLTNTEIIIPGIHQRTSRFRSDIIYLIKIYEEKNNTDESSETFLKFKDQERFSENSQTEIKN